jgi:uncharacterized protein (DUF2252 family)
MKKTPKVGSAKKVSHVNNDGSPATMAWTWQAPPTLEELLASGNALREKCPRKSHAIWDPPADRADPIAILEESNQGRLPELLPRRFGLMKSSPFAFYRGAAAIMASDLGNTPVTGLRVQACGDCHLLNFGGYATPERNLVFDINDFDETLPAPWEWDVKRLGASFVLAALENHLNDRDAREAAVRSTRAYRESLAQLARLPALDVWYARLDWEPLYRQIEDQADRKQVRKQLDRTISQQVGYAFPEVAFVEGGRPRIKDHRPKLYHPAETQNHGFQVLVGQAFQRYRDSVQEDRRHLIDRYQIADVALKVVGVGSVGTWCGVALLVATEGDHLFLQIKEARASVLETFAGLSAFPNRGQRVVTGQRLMQSASDVFLGWTEIGDGRHFYIRQLRDMKMKPPVELFGSSRLLGEYAQACGWALARAHARSGDAAKISGYLGKADTFDEAIGDFALAYAEQNARDHAAMLKAIAAGRLPAEDVE